MDNKYSYGFWVWTKDLEKLISNIASLENISLDSNQFELIKYNLVGSNDELDRWHEIQFGNISIQLAYDQEEQNDMTHLKFKTKQGLLEKIKELEKSI